MGAVPTPPRPVTEDPCPNPTAEGPCPNPTKPSLKRKEPLVLGEFTPGKRYTFSDVGTRFNCFAQSEPSKDSKRIFAQGPPNSKEKFRSGSPGVEDWELKLCRSGG